MSKYVLSLLASAEALEILAPGMIELALEFPAESERALPGGLAEITAAQAEADAFFVAERAFHVAQTEETAARQAKDASRKVAREWADEVLDGARTLVKHEPDADPLRRTVVNAFPPASRIRDSALPAYLESLSDALSPQLAVMSRSKYTAEDLAKGEALAADLRATLRPLAKAVTKRRAALSVRDTTRAALVQRLRRLDDFLGRKLPETGLVKLESLRMQTLPLRTPAEPEAAEPPSDEEPTEG